VNFVEKEGVRCLQMNKIGFCGNEEPHDEHQVFTAPDYDVYFTPHSMYICRGVDEEGTVRTEERTSIHDCEE